MLLTSIVQGFDSNSLLAQVKHIDCSKVTIEELELVKANFSVSSMMMGTFLCQMSENFCRACLDSVTTVLDIH